jgi:putative ABC transport system permease protein
MVILGLTTAFTVFLSVLVQYYHDYSYNSNFKNADDIYQLTNGLSYEELRLMKERYPAIIDYSTIEDFELGHHYSYQSIIRDDGSITEFFECKFGITDNFLEVFSPKIITGDVKQIFNEPDKVMLTKTVAQKFFGNENPIGKIITHSFYKKQTWYTVAAICEDFPDKNLSS